MKQFILFLFALAWQSGYAQDDYRPLLQDGKKWTYYEGMDIDFSDEHYFLHCWIDGDTIVDGSACKKLYADRLRIGQAAHLEACLYEEGKKVYSIDLTSHERQLLYDFGAEIGDEFSVYVGEDFQHHQVKSISQVTSKGNVFRRILLSYTTDFGLTLESEWIEGIGGITYLLVPLSLGIVGDNRRLMSCELNGQVIYDVRKTSQLPVGITSQRVVQGSNGARIFDLQGRQTSVPRHGLYIQDGKKYNRR